jgi:hypothetical protein
MIVNIFAKLHPKIWLKKKRGHENLDDIKNSYTFEFGMVGSDAKQRRS